MDQENEALEKTQKIFHKMVKRLTKNVDINLFETSGIANGHKYAVHIEKVQDSGGKTR